MVAVSIREKSLSENELLAMQDYKTSPLFSELEKAVLQYASEMTTTPVVIDDANFAVLKKHYSEKQLVELRLRLHGRTGVLGSITRLGLSQRSLRRSRLSSSFRRSGN